MDTGIKSMPRGLNLLHCAVSFTFSEELSDGVIDEPGATVSGHVLLEDL